jgi:hypothetical protein
MKKFGGGDTMLIGEIVSVALGALRANKLRSSSSRSAAARRNR